MVDVALNIFGFGWRNKRSKGIPDCHRQPVGIPNNDLGFRTFRNYREAV